MINISLEQNKNLYTNWLDSYNFLNNIDDKNYTYPKEKINFHVYTEVKNEKELECIKSFFATQNLNKTNLIIWSDYDISNLECLAPFKKYITFKIYNPSSEIIGTPLENLSYAFLKDNKYYVQSDILRILLLHKYGGVWFDMDIIFLRDFKPILDQEYMYQWGDIIDFEGFGPCGSILSIKQNSFLSNELIKEILKTPLNNYIPTMFGKDLFAKVYKKNKFTIFPSSFFNIEWLMSQLHQDWWFDTECCDEFLFLKCFSWHWHNSSNKNKIINDKSKFFKLIQINNKKLKKKGFNI